MSVRHIEREIAAVAEAVFAGAREPSAAEADLLANLQRQLDRLLKQRFQLAVTGQFKRGKSTLVNALLGEPLLAADVLPATAIPTFIGGSGQLGLVLVYRDGRVENLRPPDLADLRQRIEAATTETLNPGNRLGLARVEVTLPTRGLLDGLTIIDTPGVGSTNQKNTATAHEVLPECDAVLFVVSVDPPITDVELGFLEAVGATVERVVMVLNKVDVVTADERERLVTFTQTAVAALPDLPVTAEIFPIAARCGLIARCAGDEAALVASGIPALEAFVRDELVGGKRAIVAGSIARKVRAIVAELRAAADLRAHALSLPLTDLDRRVGELNTCAERFDRERDAVKDGLAGDWRRALVVLDEWCAALGDRIDAELAPMLKREPDGAAIETRMATIFEGEMRALAARIKAHVGEAIEVHRRRNAELAAAVRHAAGAIMEVELPDAVALEAFEIAREPYWVGSLEIDSFGSLTLGGLSRLLPPWLRRNRERQLLKEATARAALRNLSNLNWSARQSIDDTFRRLSTETAASARCAIDAVRVVVEAARRKRDVSGVDADSELRLARERAETLRTLLQRLDTIQRA